MDDVFEGCTSVTHSFIQLLPQVKSSDSCVEAVCPGPGGIHPWSPQGMASIRVSTTETLGMVWTLSRGQSGIH